MKGEEDEMVCLVKEREDMVDVESICMCFALTQELWCLDLGVWVAGVCAQSECAAGVS